MSNSIKFTSGYRINDSLTKDEFKNQVFLYLKNESMAPSYIFDEFKFDDAIKIDIPIIGLNGQAEIYYSRNIGYEKTETWMEKKTVKYSNGTKNVSYTPRSRTTTEWVEDSGVITGEATVRGYDKKFNQFSELISLDIDNKNISILSNDELQKIELSQELLDTLKNDLLNKVYSDNITYPGDFVKDEKTSGNVSILNLYTVITSVFVLEIKIRDKEVYFYARTSGDTSLKVVGDFPYDNAYDEYFEQANIIGTEKKEALKKPKRFYHMTNLLGLLGFILLLVFGIVFDILALKITSFIPIIIGFIVGYKSMKEAKRIKKEYGQKYIKLNSEHSEKIKNIKNESYERFINNYYKNSQD